MGLEPWHLRGNTLILIHGDNSSTTTTAQPYPDSMPLLLVDLMFSLWWAWLMITLLAERGILPYCNQQYILYTK